MLEKFSYARVCYFVPLLIRKFPLLFPGYSLALLLVLLSAVKIPVIKRCILILKALHINYFTKETDKKNTEAYIAHENSIVSRLNICISLFVRIRKIFCGKLLSHVTLVLNKPFLIC